jgi:hypothetical protein
MNWSSILAMSLTVLIANPGAASSPSKFVAGNWKAERSGGCMLGSEGIGVTVHLMVYEGKAIIALGYVSQKLEDLTLPTTFTVRNPKGYLQYLRKSLAFSLSKMPSNFGVQSYGQMITLDQASGVYELLESGSDSDVLLIENKLGQSQFPLSGMKKVLHWMFDQFSTDIKSLRAEGVPDEFIVQELPNVAPGYKAEVSALIDRGEKPTDVLNSLMDYTSDRKTMVSCR